MDYRDKRQCAELLSRARNSQPDEAHVLLSGLIQGMLETPPPPDEHLELLEAARPLLAQLQAGQAQHYATHPLPPDSQENELLRRVVELWRAYARTCAALTPACPATLQPLLTQRRIHALGQVILEYFRAHRSVPEGCWQALHGALAAAREAGIAQTRVVDTLNLAWQAQSPAEAHAQLLLIDLANPYGRSQREFDLVCRWAQRLAAYCSFDTEQGERKGGHYALDLASDHGLRPVKTLEPGGALHYFDANHLAERIEGIVRQLKQGVSPQALGLGDDTSTQEAGKLLVWLYRPWGLAASGRRFPRRRAQGIAELCGDWQGIGLYVQGKPFESPHVYDSQSSIHSDLQLLTLGERAVPVDQTPAQIHAKAQSLGIGAEPWTVLDQSVSGFKLRRGPGHRRLQHHQLVGVKPPDGSRFLLAQVSWLMYREDGALDIGINLLPGVPHVIAAKPVGLYVDPREPFQQAFMLPAVPHMDAPKSTLVLPGGWFHPQRVVQVYLRHSFQIRLTKLLLGGSNFDQVEFESVST